jgi:hypothetical protein
MSKEFLLRQADTLLAQARRARKSSADQPEPDRDRLLHDAEELEGRAARLESEAVSAKTSVVGVLPGGWLARLSKGA